MKIEACKCEKIAEKEFDRHPEMNEGWEELFRKNGFVYIGYRPNQSLEMDGKKTPPLS